MLTIRDHILQGNYPTDDRGRSLVPTRGGMTVKVVSAHGPEPHPVIGFFLRPDGRHFAVSSWTAEGHNSANNVPSTMDLLPPPPLVAQASQPALRGAA